MTTTLYAELLFEARSTSSGLKVSSIRSFVNGKNEAELQSAIFKTIEETKSRSDTCINYVHINTKQFKK